MEGSVWMQWFAQVAGFVSNLFASLNSPQSQSNGGASPSAPANAAASTLTSTPVTSLLLKVQRNPSLATMDALFGSLIFNEKKICCTMERTAVAIPEGIYPGRKRYSPHFGMTVLGIDVPNRTDIECHPANLPSQLEGCIAVGESIDGDALDNSRAAFDEMMSIVPQEFTVEICSSAP
jgi:Family of unknown function (DUF5675)